MVASTDTAKRVELYREAARLVHVGQTRRSCYAVAIAATGDEFGSSRVPEVKRYMKAMLDGEYFTAALPWDKEFDCAENDRIRVLLLCFMAAMVEAGDA
jgi:hypothetical protein